METVQNKIGDSERRNALLHLEWDIWRTRARPFQLRRKAKKLLIALIIGYPLSFFLVFNVFNWYPEPGALVNWRYPATTTACEGEYGLEENLTNSCVVGPHPGFCQPAIEFSDGEQYYNGKEWPFRFYYPFVRLYKYIRRNDFK